MKRLILVRHASAVPEQFPARDFDRVLAEQGLEEVAKLAAFISSKGEFPQQIVCSSAKRTAQTASLICESWGKAGLPVQEIPQLYNAGFPAMMQWLQNFSGIADSLMLVAHNPGISQLATVLSSQHPYQFATAAGLCLEFEVTQWADLQSAAGKELWYFYP